VSLSLKSCTFDTQESSLLKILGSKIIFLLKVGLRVSFYKKKLSLLSVAGLLSTTILVRGADSMRIGTLRTAGWCTLGTLASPSCGRENNQNKRGASKTCSKRRAARDRKSGSELRG